MVQVANNETKAYKDMSQEEYNLVKTPKLEVATNMMVTVRENIKNGQCGKCVEWKLKAGEVKTDNTVELDVGMWQPVSGLQIKDDLFPHKSGGMRGKKIIVGAIDVSTIYYTL